MGTLIQQTARGRRRGGRGLRASGHATTPAHAAELPRAAPAADLAIDFSRPEAARPHVLCLRPPHRGRRCSPAPRAIPPRRWQRWNPWETVAPVLYCSANFSLGIAVFVRALQAVTGVLRPDFDIEITETHHNQKADAPSGTAKLLLEATGPCPRRCTAGLRPGGQLRPPRSPRRSASTPSRGGTVAGHPHRPLLRRRTRSFEITHRAAQPPDLRQRRRGLRPAPDGPACCRLLHLQPAHV